MKNVLQTLSEVSQSPAMREVVTVISRIATSDLGILIIGEFGTGKEWIARKIHQMGLRTGKKFISIDCSTLTPDRAEQEIFGQELFGENGLAVEEGIFEEAHGGTIFFEGFSALPLDLRLKIARAAEHQKFHRVGGHKELWFDARITVAAAQRPDAKTPEGAMDRDILYRLTPVVIDLPPLRNRQEDLLVLLNKFITQTNERYKTKVRGITAEALKICMDYDWPGNIRELRNMVEYSGIMAQDQLIQPAHLPLQMRHGQVSEEIKTIFHEQRSVESVEKYLIEDILRRAHSRKEAARLLGISIKTLYNKLERYGLQEAPTQVQGQQEEKEQEHQQREDKPADQVDSPSSQQQKP